MEVKGFPYDPTLLAFLVGILAGIFRGIQARAKMENPTAREKLDQVLNTQTATTKPSPE